MRFGGLSDLLPVKKKSPKRLCVAIVILAAALFAMYYGSDYDWRYPAVIGPMLLVSIVVDVVRSDRLRHSDDGG